MVAINGIDSSELDRCLRAPGFVLYENGLCRATCKPGLLEINNLQTID